jgi:hypothetical protein
VPFRPAHPAPQRAGWPARSQPSPGAPVLSRFDVSGDELGACLLTGSRTPLPSWLPRMASHVRVSYRPTKLRESQKDSVHHGTFGIDTDPCL